MPLYSGGPRLPAQKFADVFAMLDHDDSRIAKADHGYLLGTTTGLDEIWRILNELNLPAWIEEVLRMASVVREMSIDPMLKRPSLRQSL